MILWKQPFEITKEIKRQKGNNYKARDIGPFVRLCNKCNNTKIEYLTYDQMNKAEKQNIWCKECLSGPKGKTGQFSRQCGNKECSEIIFYKQKRDFDSAVKNNTQCQKCNNKKLSNLYKGKGLHFTKTEEEQKSIIQKVTHGRIKFYENNPEKLKEVQLKRAKKSKIYLHHGYHCQGTYEVKYIDSLISNTSPLPLQNDPFVNTPYGNYLPDFEFQTHFIEIKSNYTYNCTINKTNKYKSSNQIDKIIWTNQNIKPVIILIFNNKEKVFEEVNYIADYKSLKINS